MYRIFEQLMREKGVTAYRVYKETGISQTTLSDWKRGLYTPKQDKLQKIADYFDVSLEYLMTGQCSRNGVKIPVYGKVAAGIPIEAIEDIIDYEEIPSDMARTGEFLALQIKGDSMEPKFSTGDVVIVRRQSDVEDGEIAVVMVNGEETTVKKIKHSREGITIIPTNPAYEQRFFSNREIETLPVTILGKVVELRAKF